MSNTTENGEVLLDVRGLRVAFACGRSLLAAVDGVDLRIAAGETLALLGESGCGKSATALGLLRLLPAAGRIVAGEVRFAGRDLLRLPESEMRSVRGGGMAMIFQEPATSLNPVLTVGRQLGEVLERHLGLGGEAARLRAQDLLSAVGIADPQRRLDEYPFQLSGGMKQRVMIASALAGNPQLLVADEPTTALDVTIQAQILELLRQLQSARAMGMLLITHDLGVVAQMATRVGVMYAGEVVEEAPREDFFGTPRHPYTQRLFAALPDLAQRGGRLETITGQVPALSAMPVGCRFAARCPYVWELCRRQAPLWREVAAGHRLRCHLETATASARAAEPSPVTQQIAPEACREIALLAVTDLRVHFPIRKGILQRVVGHVRAVDGVSLTLERARTLALVGESGCGKTTVGKAILQLLPTTVSRGRIAVHGQEVVGRSGRSGRAADALRQRMQMIFQDPFASLNPRLSVGEIIGEGLQAQCASTRRREIAAAVGAVLQQVGLDSEAAGRYPHEFSGGQRQRIAIARALIVQPDLVICDEPTSALDVSVQAQILNLLARLQNDLGLAYLFITHNFAVVNHLAHAVAVMYLGRIVEQGSVDEVLRNPQHPYSRALLSAVPSPRLDVQSKVIRLSGEMPSSSKPPSGCHFHPRCPQASAACVERYPPTTSLTATHTVSCHLYTDAA